MATNLIARRDLLPMSSAPPRGLHEVTFRHRHQETSLLEAAQAGNERAYQELLEPYRRELHAHCYRMLGTVQDADDALQDALLRAWRGLPGFAGRSSLRTWLFKVTTNACLATIERRPRRPLPIDCGPAADPHTTQWEALESGMIGPYPDEHLGVGSGLAAPSARYEQRESVELAFVAALQHIPGTQRAVLILRDVLGFSARETAEALETTVASVTSALQRARRTVEERMPDRSQQAALHALGDAQLRRLVERYVDAWERGDAAAILGLLAEDANFSMPPYPVWYHGKGDIKVFLALGPLTECWRQIPVSANGQLAFGCYRWDSKAGIYTGHSIDVLTLDGERVTQMTAFLDPALIATFGLPEHLPRQ